MLKPFIRGVNQSKILGTLKYINLKILYSSTFKCIFMRVNTVDEVFIEWSK